MSSWLSLDRTGSFSNSTTLRWTAQPNATGADRIGRIDLGEKTLTVTQFAAASQMSLSRNDLRFGWSWATGKFTPPQSTVLTFSGPGSRQWSASSSSPWLKVTPASGTGSSTIRVEINTAGPLPGLGTASGEVIIGPSDGSRFVILRCSLNTIAGSTAPFGTFDTPTDNPAGLGGNLAISGSTAVTGWALDDIGVKQVTIWRDPVGPEPVHPNGYVYIGDALFVAGARPDVEQKYLNSPQANRAGWGYMLLTNPLPGKGNGVFRVHAIASDEEGNQVKLGTKTIAVDNLRAVKPFGALDTPAPGQTISGSFMNSGWALTPQPSAIATNGSTISVIIDGVDIGSPSFGSMRSDVAGIFPGYANTYTSAGQYALDTTRYSNAMHTIAWIVYDNNGNGDGIGSRFFNIQNGATAASADPERMMPEAAEQSLAGQRPFQASAARAMHHVAPANAYPAFRRGHNRNAELVPIRSAGQGLLQPIELDELDRMEIHLPGGQEWTAALRVGDERRELPIGSSFDAEGGIFYWQLGPGFLGEFFLEFRGAGGAVLRVPVNVGARTARERSSLAR